MHLGCFDGCDKEDKAAFAAKLCHLSQLTWDEISSQNRYKMGFELLPQDQIKVPIPKHITPEVRIMVFRFHGMKPMLGYRDGQIYYPFWLDTDFSAYDHGS